MQNIAPALAQRARAQGDEKLADWIDHNPRQAVRGFLSKPANRKALGLPKLTSKEAPWFEIFGSESAPQKGQKGHRPGPQRHERSLDGRESAEVAQRALTWALWTWREPEWTPAWAELGGAGEEYLVRGEEREDYWSALELLDTLGIPEYGPDGEKMGNEKRAELATRVLNLAHETREPGTGSVGAKGERYRRTETGELPMWAAVAIVQDWLLPPGKHKLRLVNLTKAEAAEFIGKHHSALPCMNPKGLMYALGAMKGDNLVAVATAGTPTGPHADPDNVVELTRIASDGSVLGASSKLAKRIIDLLDTSRRDTLTLKGEFGPVRPTLFVTYSLWNEKGTTYKALRNVTKRAARKDADGNPIPLPGGGPELRPTEYKKGQAPSGSRKGAYEALPAVDKVRWEAGGRAAPEDPTALERAAQEGKERWDRRDADLFNYFPSASNQVGKIEAMGESGMNVGVNAEHVNERAMKALEAFPGRVFMDSGAFEEVKFNTPITGKDNPRRGQLRRPDLPKGAPYDVKPITHKDWRNRLAQYKRLARALGNRLYVVAPDKVADQDETLRRLRKYADDVREISKLKANIIIPIQKGAMTMCEMDAAVTKAVGFKGYVRGIPLKKDATTVAQLRDMMAECRPARVHMLGLSPRSDKYKAVRKVLDEFAVCTRITWDSVLFLSQKFTGRPKHKGREHDVAHWTDDDGTLMVSEREDVEIEVEVDGEVKTRTVSRPVLYDQPDGGRAPGRPYVEGVDPKPPKPLTLAQDEAWDDLASETWSQAGGLDYTDMIGDLSSWMDEKALKRFANALNKAGLLTKIDRANIQRAWATGMRGDGIDEWLGTEAPNGQPWYEDLRVSALLDAEWWKFANPGKAPPGRRSKSTYAPAPKRAPREGGALVAEKERRGFAKTFGEGKGARDWKPRQNPPRGRQGSLGLG